MRPRVILSGQPLTSIAMGNGRPWLPAIQSNVAFCKEEIGEGLADTCDQPPGCSKFRGVGHAGDQAANSHGRKPDTDEQFITAVSSERATRQREYDTRHLVSVRAATHW